MFISKGPRAALATVCISAFTLTANTATADAVSDFYKSRNVEVYIGTNPGGGYDLYGRLIARHMASHIPGSPSMIAKNMPGAGHLKMVNWLYNAAPREGTALAVAPQAIAIEQGLGSDGIQYDARRFTWIGRVAPIVEVTFTWHTSPTKTLEDARKRETIMAGSGPTSPTVFYLKLLNGLAGTKFKIIPSYAGTAEVQLGIERGEVEGGSKAWESMKVDNADWLRDKKVNILLQYAGERSADLPDVPLLSELGTTDADRAALRIYALGNELGRSIMATPDIPQDRVAALRKAFMATMQSPALQAEVKKMKIDVGALPGDKVAGLIDETLKTPKAIFERAREARGY
jgi:tripartite-type tricarboxylate transporter receptor subunit TctC